MVLLTYISLAIEMISIYNFLMPHKFSIIFKNIGLKCTPKRLAIMSIIDQSNTYLSPEDVWKQLKVRFEQIGLPTVYRNLDDLAKAGAISPIIHPNRQLYYYYCSNEVHHHHFICTGCRRVFDIQSCAIKYIQKEVENMNAKIDSHILQINGRCETCVS
jgi:Fur family transcriptional regulator, ferric uptake regulator